MRIGIDVHAIGQRATGNERFIVNVTRALRDSCDDDLVLFFSSHDTAGSWPVDDRTAVRVIEPAGRAMRLAYALPKMAKQEDLDVLLVQYTAPKRTGCPVVTVVHDVSFAEHPEWFSRSERLWMRRTIPATMARAGSIVTVSEFSKTEIARLYGVPPAKIVVARDGVDPVFTEGDNRGPAEPMTFLSVGNIEPRKNLDVLLEAFAIVRRSHPEATLNIVGGTKRGGAVQDLANVRYFGYVSDPELAGMMRTSTALCYPSLYEGFGLPPLEALASGTPALVADIPVMREILADYAVRLPGDDPVPWAKAMIESGTMPEEERQKMSDRGRAHAATFSWHETAANLYGALIAAASRP